MSGYYCPRCNGFIATDSDVMMTECGNCNAEIIDQLRVMRTEYLQQIGAELPQATRRPSTEGAGASNPLTSTSGMETRQGGNEVPSRSDDSPTAESGDAQND